MCNSQFHDASVALLSERWTQQKSLEEIDRARASIDTCMTGHSTPPPRPLHDGLEDIKASGRGGPSPRPLQPEQLSTA